MATTIDYVPPTPNPKQEEFLRNLINPLYQINGMMGGWGAGKTQVMTQAITDVTVAIPGNKIAVVRNVRADIKKTIWAELTQTINPYLIADQNETEFTIVMNTLIPGVYSTIEMKGMDQASRWGSTFFGHIFFDEVNECRKEEMIALLGRLRHKFSKETIEFLRTQMGDRPSPHLQLLVEEDPKTGEEILTYDVHRFLACAWNPQDKTHWLHDFFVKDRKSNTSFVKCSSRDNWHNLPKSYRELLESLDEYTQWVYVDGNWGSIPKGPPATPNFNRKKNCFREPLPAYPMRIGVGIDFGYTYPAVGFFEFRNDGDEVIKWAECMGHRQTLREFIPDIRRCMSFFHPETEFFTWCDNQAAEAKCSQSNVTNVQTLRDNGLHPRHEYSTPIERAEQMDDLFRTGRFKVHESCEHAIAAYAGGWCRDPKNNNKIDKDPTNPSHNVADADGYIIRGYFGKRPYKEARHAGHKSQPKRNWLNAWRS